jgi:hypothetical protein
MAKTTTTPAPATNGTPTNKADAVRQYAHLLHLSDPVPGSSECDLEKPGLGYVVESRGSMPSTNFLNASRGLPYITTSRATSYWSAGCAACDQRRTRLPTSPQRDSDRAARFAMPQL